MSRANNHVKIDTEYLSEIVRKSGLTHREFCATLGRTESLIHKARQRGYLQRPCAELLCKVHGADINKLIIPEIPDSWIPVTEKMPEEKDTMFAKFWGTDKWNEYMKDCMYVELESTTGRPLPVKQVFLYE